MRLLIPGRSATLAIPPTPKSRVGLCRKNICKESIENCRKKKVSAIYEKVNPDFDLTHLGLGPPASHPQAATFATVA